MKGFSSLPNAVLELKTKSADVEGLLELNHNGHTVVSWSLNPQEIIDMEEHGTASLPKRLEAMKVVVNAGYLVGIHLDPMILYQDWRRGYKDLIEMIFNNVDARRIAWISIGSLRFNPEMKKTIESNFPSSSITASEMITGPDGKTRYVKPIRVEMYKFVFEAISRYNDKFPIPIYLCMERQEVWKRVMGYSPNSTAHLDHLITKSLLKRYPELFKNVLDIRQ